MKERIKKKYGTMRNASVACDINYYRLSNITNGWITPRPDEIKRLGIKPSELKKVKNGTAGKSCATRG